MTIPIVQWFLPAAQAFFVWRASGLDRDSETWRVFDDLIRSRLTTFARRALSERTADIPDAVQITFTEIYEQKLDAPPSDVEELRRWFYQCAGTVCARFLYENKRRAKTATLDDVEVVYRGEGPQTQVRRKELCEIVREEVARLPKLERVCLKLHQWRKCSADAIAAKVKRGRRTVYEILERARDLLRIRLAARGFARA